MKQYSYYSYQDNVHAFLMCSRQSDKAPIIVNCFGQICQETDFFTSAKRDDYYLLIMTEGTLEVDMGDETQIIKKGDAIIFHPGFLYKYHNKNCDKVNYYWLHFTGGYAKEYIKSLNLETLKTIHGLNHIEISNLFDKTYLKTINVGTFLSDELSVFAYNVLLCAAKASCDEKGENRLYKSLSYINENYTKDIPVKTLADMEGISVSRYNFVFLNTVGTSPIKYITGLRLNKARYLLDSTLLSVSKISDMCGFSNPHYFHRVFKNHFGTTPRNFHD